MEKSTIDDLSSFSQMHIASKTHPTAKLYRSYQEVVSNFYTYDFKGTLGVALYSITVTHKTEGNTNPYYSLIKRISRSKAAIDYLKKFFVDFYITGNSLFGKTCQQASTGATDVGIEKEMTQQPPIDFKVSWMNNIVEIKHKDEEFENQEEVYTVSINKKFELKNYNEKNITKDEKEHIRRFMNIIIQNYLEKLQYIKTEPGVKAVYYKKGFGEHMKPLGGGVYFVSGYKVSTNFYDNNEILVKTVQKFRMLREQTYLDYYKYLSNKFNSEESINTYYGTFIKNRCGLAKHTERRVKISSVIFGVNIMEFKFSMKKKDSKDVQEISLFEYYKLKYNIVLREKVQPLAEQIEIRRAFNNEKVTHKTHFPFELLYILGKIENEDKLDISKATLIAPTEKFNRTHKLMRELRSAIIESQNENTFNENKITKSTNLNFSLKTIKSGILHMPLIELGHKKVINPDQVTGNFDLKNGQPYENDPLGNWLIFTYDVKENEYKDIGNLFAQAKIALGMNFEQPQAIHIDTKFERNSLVGYFNETFSSLGQIIGNDKMKKPELILLILSKRKEYVYQFFKNALNNSKLCIRSQVVKKESLIHNFQKGLTVASNVLLQIWAKRGLAVWRSKGLKKSSIHNIMVAGYSVGYSSAKLQGITSLSASYNSDLTSYLNYCEFHECWNKASPKIGDLLGRAVEVYFQLNGSKPDKILLYREGLSSRQREKIVETEINLMKKHPSIANIPITLVFVNKICDLRFFQEESSERDPHDMNKTFFELNQTKISLSEDKLYTNLLPGSVIESGVTINGTNEFYIVSTFSKQGTCNPTNYIVEYDDSNFDKNVLFKITYDLTFLYYNNSKCIRIPLPLQSSTRMVNHASKYLTESSYNSVDYNFGY